MYSVEQKQYMKFYSTSAKSFPGFEIPGITLQAGMTWYATLATHALPWRF